MFKFNSIRLGCYIPERCLYGFDTVSVQSCTNLTLLPFSGKLKQETLYSNLYTIERFKIMSYSISIVRKNNWEDIEEKSNITLGEWLNFIDKDEELEHPSKSDLTDNNRDYYKQKQGYCEWIAHSSFKEPFARPWFDYYKGQIIAENVDDETMLKMIAIAEHLKAKVQGQDGEFFDEDDAMNVRVTSENNPAPQMPVNKKPWWKFWSA